MGWRLAAFCELGVIEGGEVDISIRKANPHLILEGFKRGIRVPNRNNVGKVRAGNFLKVNDSTDTDARKVGGGHSFSDMSLVRIYI